MLEAIPNEQYYHLHQASKHPTIIAIIATTMATEKVPNVILHRFNAFWLLYSLNEPTECQKVKWNANEKLSQSIDTHAHTHTRIPILLAHCRQRVYRKYISL